MPTFTVVKEAPTTLEKGDYVIDRPRFLEEIEQNKNRAGRSPLTASGHLRMILDSIARNYDPERMSAYSARVSNFEGRPYSTNEDLSDIIIEMLQQDYPAVFQKYLEKKIKDRPKGTSHIYYVDSNIKNMYETFYQAGFSDTADEKPQKEKSSRVVGKPAVTKEQAEQLKKEREDVE